MKITNKWLKEQDSCREGYEWALKQKEREELPFIHALLKDNHWDWANWVIVRVMTYDQYVSYAVFAAEQVIDIYEKKYPDDKRPRNAIEAAKKCIGLKGDAAGDAARDAAWAALAAARAAGAALAAARAAGAAARAAGDAARAAGDAARAARDAAWAAGYAAWAAEDAAWSAARASAGAAGDAGDAMKTKIINYGISLIEKTEG